MRIILLVLAAGALAAFSGKAPQEKSNEPMSLTQMAAKAKELSADKSCSKDTDCDAVPMGKKLCGGPAYYQIFSKKNTDEKEMMKLSKMHVEAAKAQSQQKAKAGMVGNCMMIMKPGLACNNGQCRPSAGKGIRF